VNSGDIIYIKPKNYNVQEINFTEYALLSYDADRKSPYGVWTEKNKLMEMLKK